MRLVVFLLASYGVTNIVTGSELLAGARAFLAERSAWFGRWVRCPMCVGVAAGVGWRLAGLELGADLELPLAALVAGAVASGWCWTCRVVLARLGEDDL